MEETIKYTLNNLKNLIVLTILLNIVILFGCYPSIKRDVTSPGEALIPVRYFYPDFRDDMDIGSLILAIKRNLEYLDRLNPDSVFTYGPQKYTCQQVRDSQSAFLKILSESADINDLEKKVKRHFQIYRAAGRIGKRQVLFTGYFEPVFEASLSQDEIYRYPIYKRPDDLIRIDLSTFNSEYKGESIIGRIDGKKVVPYYSRKQIEMDKVLGNRGLEIAWLKDPVDVAFLHIQGSGRLMLPDGQRISVGYMSSNGRPYNSIGRYMIDRGYLDNKDMSMQGIRRYLSQNHEVIDKVLNYNPSYVFFETRKNGPFGNINVPLTPGRSIALSSRLFPKGSLCFISSKKPVLNEKGEIDHWTNFSRFVMNQDTGGAIKGSGRADIFWGSDRYAELAAGNMKHDGELYLLIKKY